jgi:predicted PurR-regulated permease PerM
LHEYAHSLTVDEIYSKNYITSGIKDYRKLPLERCADIVAIKIIAKFYSNFIDNIKITIDQIRQIKNEVIDLIDKYYEKIKNSTTVDFMHYEPSSTWTDYKTGWMTYMTTVATNSSYVITSTA